MKSKIIFGKELFFVIFLLLFSILINQYYGNKGVFPVDSFSHFDTGFRILLGEHPFKDFWIISGPLVDYIQSLFFYLFGLNWQVYVFHASVFNGIITVLTFIVLRNFKLNIFYSFIYSLFFSVLAYPSSGTPFVDHHSTFFSLIGIYILILAIKNENFLYWFLFPIFFGFAFLSKQVPATYVIIFVTIILIFYSIVYKKYSWIKYSISSTIFFIIILLIFGKIKGIHLSVFLEQYIYYPQTIGEKRFSNLNISINSDLGHFKFIFLSIAPLVYINIKSFFDQKKYFQKKDFIYFLILILFMSVLIFHQLITRNQTFIFFLIPIMTAFSHISVRSEKKIVSFLLILFCFFATTKYHLRFNENRKFHELYNSNFELAINAQEIDKKLAGLKWISPEYSNPEEELQLINEIIKLFRENDKNKMIMTNYSFFSLIFEENFFSTTRWHIFDGTDYPQKNSDYYMSYKKLLLNKIKKNKIEVIYTINPVKRSNIYDYINEDCFKEEKITKILTSYKLEICKEING